MDTTPKRKPRHPISLFVGLAADGDPPGRTRNISVSGLFLETGKRPPVGSLVDLWFVWGEDTFTGKARVIRHAQDGIGLAFVEPDKLFLDAIAEIVGIAP
jgi:hypothetical protein